MGLITGILTLPLALCVGLFGSANACRNKRRPSSATRPLYVDLTEPGGEELG